MMDPLKTVREKIEELPTQSYCAYAWSGAAIGPSGQVFPCCRWMGPHTEGDPNIPNIKDGLKAAREGDYFSKIRHQMIKGEYPSGCAKCWRIEKKRLQEEDAGIPSPQNSVPRVQIGHQLEVTSTKPKTEKIRYLETGISNLCNMACVMCGPNVSSTIWTIQKPGQKVPKGFHQDNKNINEDLSELRYLKFVGGEPMLEKKHDDLLEMVIRQNEDPSQLEIEYHTNASVFPSERVIACWKKIKLVRIIFSLDGVSEKVKLQRPGKYIWQDIEDTVDKYVAITNEVNVEFSSNTVLTSLNIGQGIDIVKWLYEKVGTHRLGWFNVNPECMPKSTSKYLNHRNLSKETKERIKKEIADFGETAHPALKTPIAKILDIIVHVIDERGDLDEDLTRELILEKHTNNIRWKHFGEELKNLDI